MSANEAFASLEALAADLRTELQEKKFVLLYAYNGTGKTRLFMAFKDIASKAKERAPRSFYDPLEMLPKNKANFEKFLTDFLNFYPFNSELTPQPKQEPTP